jgi:hypothetical protein
VEIAAEGILRLQILRCYTRIMNTDPRSLADFSNHELLQRVESLASKERAATAQLIAALAELDARRLYLGQGFSSLFAYCTRQLKLSEHAAYGRIEAARVVRRFPSVLTLIADGLLTLTNLCLLAPHLTAHNCATVVAAAVHKSKREVERQVAELRPVADVPSTVRKLPQRSAPLERSELFDGTDAGSTPSTPRSPKRYKVQFTITQETHDKLCHAQNLLRHSGSYIDPAVVFDRALTILIAELERTKLGHCSRPRQGRVARPGSRHLPRAVRRDVWKRDGGQCAFIGSAGRCTERRHLEFHHVVPFASGGPSTVANIELRCRAHNAYEAELHFGLTESSFLRERQETPEIHATPR